MGNGESAKAQRKICAAAIIHSMFIHFVLKLSTSGPITFAGPSERVCRFAWNLQETAALW